MVRKWHTKTKASYGVNWHNEKELLSTTKEQHNQAPLYNVYVQYNDMIFRCFKFPFPSG